MSTQAYRIDLDDVLFTLFDQLHADDVLAPYDAYEGMDRATLTDVLSEARRVAVEVLAPVNPIGDREGVHFDGQGAVTTPEVFKEAWTTMAEGGWIAVDGPVDAGGMGLPHVINAATHEMFSGAATAFMMYPGLTAAAARVVHQFAPEALRELVATRMFTGAWAGTMCLTEAGAGSDVGANRTKATPTDDDGVYLLEGEKIFISGGDHDLADNIIHLVLARLPDAPPGTRGLSIFLVPKFDFDADGTLGDRNGVYVGGIEEKMGIHGSATCTVLLGDRGPCKGWLLGSIGQGMPIMFHMMNEARVGVGIQGLGLAAHAYGNALAYTVERKQGASLADLRNPGASSVAIRMHPDVRRMLLLQKCQVEAMRAVTLELGLLHDVSEHDPDEARRAAAAERIDLLTPVVKAHFTDLAVDLTSTAVQCFGGYGYIGEYPVEQHLRDARITPIYEGTNGIQAMDLLGRKLRLQGGQVFMRWLGDAQQACAEATEAGLTAPAEAVGKALGQLGATAMHISGLASGGKLDQAMLQASPFLRMFGLTLLGVASLRQATVATAQVAAGASSPLLKGKLANVRFYTTHLLPQAVALGKGIQADDGAALEPGLFGAA